MLRTATILITFVLTATACTREPLPPTPAPFSGPTPGAPGLSVLYGAVTLDGAPASVGTVITVQVNGVGCGSGPVRQPGRYEVVVASDAEKRGCGRPGDPVLVFLGNPGDPGGAQFDQRGSFQPSSQQLDLTLKGR